MTDELAHYGVKGMRWGVTRTDEQLDSARSARKAARAERREARKERREDKRQVRLKKENETFDKQDANARAAIERHGGSKGRAATVAAGGGIAGGLLAASVGSAVASILADSGSPALAVAVQQGSAIVGGIVAANGIGRSIDISTLDNGYRERYNAAAGYDPERAARAASK